VDFTGDAGEVAISEDEKRYLCAAVNAYFKRKISPADVIWTYSGVRPLYDDAAESASSATRDYVLELDHAAGAAPLLSIFGGKITTFRKLAEHALARLEEAMGPLGKPWTASAPLPGGDMPGADFEGCLERFPERPARPHAGGKDDADAADGRARPADRGRVLFDGADVTGVPVQKRNVAMVYQQFINYPSLTVYENIASPLRVARTPRPEIDRRVREVAEFMHLTPMLDRVPLELSGGQQQRTALARALVKKAELVLLDEPLANLDYKLREEMRAELPRIFRESAPSSSMPPPSRSRRCCSAAIPRRCTKAKVTQFGPTAEVYRRPVDLVTAATFSDPPLNVLDVSKSGAGVASRNGALRSPPPAASPACRRRLHDRPAAPPPASVAARQPGRGGARHRDGERDHRL
jgi:energy-coupling factor transporter ATP-binding protein EcfA2